MALAELPAANDEIPEDSFRIRIAIVRASRGWNITQAANACGIKAENWRLWEKEGRKPQNYEEVCRKISEGSGFSRKWLAAGGTLLMTCLIPVENPANQQLELSFLPPPELSAA